MGYLCRTLPPDDGIKLKKENLEKAFQLAKELNGKQTEPTTSLWCIKHGTQTPQLEKPKESKSVGNPNVFFSRVPWNYDEICKDIFDVFKVFGFETKTNSNGDITTIEYPYNEDGDESALLVTIAPYIEHHRLYFVGEDGALWFYDFNSANPKGCNICTCNKLAEKFHFVPGMTLLLDKM